MQTQSKKPKPTGSNASLFPSIRALRLEIRTRWKRPTVIPGPVIGNVLRGALGITLRRLVCPEEWLGHDCHPCPLYRDCAYGQIFAPTPSADAAQLRLQQDLPRPFVLEPPGLDVGSRPGPLPDGRDTRMRFDVGHKGSGSEPQSESLEQMAAREALVPIFQPADGINFGLILFGTACDRLPYFISTLDRLGHDGMGRDRVPFTVETISARHPARNELLFTAGSTAVSLPQRTITTDDLLAEPRGAASRVPPPLARGRKGWGAWSTPDVPDAHPTTDHPRITLRFLTPLLLKSGSGIDFNGRRIPAREIRDRPPFGVIIRRIRDRLSALCAFFGEPWQHPDFASLGMLADTVRLVDSRTTWLTRNRRSTRTGQQHEISGLVGEAVYEFPNPETCAILSPFLKFAELLHVGKLAPWGNGAIQVSEHVIDNSVETAE